MWAFYSLDKTVSASRSQCNLWGLKTHRWQSNWNYHTDIYLICAHNLEIQNSSYRYSVSSIKSFNLWKCYLYHMRYTFPHWCSSLLFSLLLFTSIQMNGEFIAQQRSTLKHHQFYFHHIIPHMLLLYHFPC